MKEYGEGKLQLVAMDSETDKNYTLSIGKLIQNADVEAIKTVGRSLDSLVEGQIIYAKIVETYAVNL